MLTGTVWRDGKIIGRDVALNDIVIGRDGHLRVVRFKNYVNDVYLNSYNADGIIISTPTGSTGYSLSCGGPIVAPNGSMTLMTPIAPHTLNTRSIIFPAEDVITVEIGANDVLVPIMYGIASAMGGPQVFEALLPMLEGDFRQMDASSFAALRENLDSLNITAQQRKALLQLLSSGIADICAQSQATTLANLEALLQELKALNPDAQIVLVGYYNPVPLLPAPANPFVKHFRTLNRSVQKLAQQYDVAFASAAYTLVANDAHPTACGHKYLARQILKALEK